MDRARARAAVVAVGMAPEESAAVIPALVGSLRTPNGVLRGAPVLPNRAPVQTRSRTDVHAEAALLGGIHPRRLPPRTAASYQLHHAGRFRVDRGSGLVLGEARRRALRTTMFDVRALRRNCFVAKRSLRTLAVVRALRTSMTAVVRRRAPRMTMTVGVHDSPRRCNLCCNPRNRCDRCGLRCCCETHPPDILRGGSDPNRLRRPPQCDLGSLTHSPHPRTRAGRTPPD
mmetsp:Transcript_44378/g.51998  ORF Transcript_44378/g.51998 Transcript_44378/m.51998 type:complete len:229 (-) Transcript_44378:414-1100(-)